MASLEWIQLTVRTNGLATAMAIHFAPHAAWEASFGGEGHCEVSTRIPGSAFGSGPSAEGNAIQRYRGTFSSE